MDHGNDPASETLHKIYIDNLKFHSIVAKNLAAIVILLLVIAVTLFFK